MNRLARWGLGFYDWCRVSKNRVTKERARDLAAKIVWRCYEQDFILPFWRIGFKRICPPLVIKPDELDRGLSILETAIDDAVRGRVPDSVLDTVKGW